MTLPPRTGVARRSPSGARAASHAGPRRDPSPDHVALAVKAETHMRIGRAAANRFPCGVDSTRATARSRGPRSPARRMGPPDQSQLSLDRMRILDVHAFAVNDVAESRSSTSTRPRALRDATRAPSPPGPTAVYRSRPPRAGIGSCDDCGGTADRVGDAELARRGVEEEGWYSPLAADHHPARPSLCTRSPRPSTRGPHLPGEFRGCPHVVVVEEGDERPRGTGDAGVARAGNPRDTACRTSVTLGSSRPSTRPSSIGAEPSSTTITSRSTPSCPSAQESAR